MRVIKFRGKRIDNGAWETGCVVVLRQGLSDEKWFIADKMTGYHTPVDAETVGQFTGLHDVTGKDIYEGDIVQGLEYADFDFGKDGEVASLVVWDSLSASFVFDIGGKYFACMNASHSVKVIGNIQDNPELLDGIVKR